MSPHEPLLEDLAIALEREARLAESLGVTLVRQRAAVAADDAGAVNETVDEIGRSLQLLDEARRRRAELFGLLAAIPNAALEGRSDALPPRLAAARVRLREAAAAVAREAAINRNVLNRTVEAGELFLQRLFSSGSEPESFYRASERPADPGGAPGVLLDRTA
jgi:hypothetical protein